MPGFVWKSNSGCLLPFLIIFNLFFGKSFFNSTRLWLGIEVVLILIFILKINTMVHKISQQLRPDSRGFKPNGKIIDVQGQVVEEKEKLR